MLDWENREINEDAEEELEQLEDRRDGSFDGSIEPLADYQYEKRKREIEDRCVRRMRNTDPYSGNS